MDPKTYHLKDHEIDVDKIDRHALYILEKLQAKGYKAYLVGGSVRDLLLNKKPKDFDISTSAKPEEIKTLFSNCFLIGKRFRLAHIRFGRKIIEVSTFRAGDIESELLITHDNVWGDEEEDVLRRDFTINGLFYDSSEQMIIDYVEGYPDIQKKYLRAIGQPFVRFKQDPVRMIRMLKFQARFGFEIEQEMLLALQDCKGEITKSSQARILKELLRMLELGFAKPFFKLMTDHGLIQLLLPGLGEFLETEEGQEIYAYLDEIDMMHQEGLENPVDRAVLLSCFIFPLLESHIQTQYIDREKRIHLGEIQNEASHVISEVFHPFFHLPRRIRGEMVALLTSQYRITPIDKRKKRAIRVPKIPDFHMAIQFLEIRARIEPGLQEIQQQWQEAYEKHGIPPEEDPPKKRRRRRRQ